MNQKLDPNYVAELATVIYLYDIEGDSAQLLSRLRKKKVDISPEESIAILEEAAKLADKPSIKSYLCPALSSSTDDLRTIAITLASTLSSLAATGQIAVPLSAVIVAGLAVIVFRAGVKAYCSDRK